MSTRDQMKERLRLELGDFVEPFQASFQGDGSTTQFKLPHENIEVSASTPFEVSLGDGSEVTGYTLNSDNGLLVLENPVSTGDTLIVDGYHAEVFSMSNLDAFLDTAFALHNVRRNPPVDEKNIDGAEEYAIVLKGKVQALWVLAADASRDIDVVTVEGVRVPRSQRFQQLMVMLRAAEQQYDEIAANLNIGLERMEQFTLRRRSRTTNRLVPVYMSQEVDDYTLARRVLPPIDTQGADLPVPTVTEEDIQIYQGKSFSTSMTLVDDNDDPRNLTDYTFDAVIYRGPHDTVKTDRFNVVVDSATDGEVTLSLTQQQTQDLERGHPYVYLFKIWDASGEPYTVRKGNLLLETDVPEYLREDDAT